VSNLLRSPFIFLALSSGLVAILP